MSSKEEQYEALVDFVEESGKTVDTFRDYQKGFEGGHDLELKNYAGLWLLISSFDDDSEYKLFIDEDEARDEFARAKTEIEKEKE